MKAFQEITMKKVSSGFESLLRGLAQAKEHEEGTRKYPVRKISVSPLKTLTSLELKQIRREIGMSQGLLAAFLGVSVKTVEAWESDKNPVPGPVSRFLPLVLEQREFFEKRQILQF